jgi:L-rhamnose isomerase/sugar isomerase
MTTGEERVRATLSTFGVETASWSYGNTGTRFKVFPQPGAPRNAYEKVADAAEVHRLTDAAPSVALHIPWDRVDDFAKLARFAEDEGIRIGAINPNLFQEPEYMLGSVCHPDEAVRRKAIDHLRECVEIAVTTGSKILSLWFADGTNYPGQDSMRQRQERLHDALATVYAEMPSDMTMLLEYKFFEPAFYHTDVCDWGVSYAQCLRLGERAKVLIDTGHHAPGTNIEFLVATLLGLGRLGGFHFNSRNYADDDLMVGSADPFELFLILREVVDGGGLDGRVAFMLDQCHNIEPRVPATLRSVMNVQEALAKALLVDEEALAAAQKAGDVLGANAIVMDAFSSDVRPLLAEIRASKGLDPDPLAAYARSGYAVGFVAEGGRAAGSGWA